jgi:heme/copper-type cytochrome/quinol oxidase subunit 2
VSASLAGLMFWLSVASCVVAQVAIIRATLRVSGASASDSTLQMPHPRRWLEIVWVILPAIALAALLVVTWRDIDSPRVDRHIFPPAATTPPSLP